LREVSFKWREGKLIEKKYDTMARENDRQLKELRKRLKEFKEKWQR
jgi:hypothetical protein